MTNWRKYPTMRLPTSPFSLGDAAVAECTYISHRLALPLCCPCLRSRGCGSRCSIYRQQRLPHRRWIYLNCQASPQLLSPCLQQGLSITPAIRWPIDLWRGLRFGSRLCRLMSKRSHTKVPFGSRGYINTGIYILNLYIWVYDLRI
jgi:hypothetical protein